MHRCRCLVAKGPPSRKNSPSGDVPPFDSRPEFRLHDVPESVTLAEVSDTASQSHHTPTMSAASFGLNPVMKGCYTAGTSFCLRLKQWWNLHITRYISLALVQQQVRLRAEAGGSRCACGRADAEAPYTPCGAPPLPASCPQHVPELHRPVAEAGCERSFAASVLSSRQLRWWRQGWIRYISRDVAL
jgi:hypothetical protein